MTPPEPERELGCSRSSLRRTPAEPLLETLEEVARGAAGGGPPLEATPAAPACRSAAGTTVGAARGRRAGGAPRGGRAPGGGGLRGRRGGGASARRASRWRRLAAAGQPLLLVADLGLPSEAGSSFRGGLDVARYASGLPQPPPVLLMSETIDEKLRARAKRARRLAARLQARAVEARPAPVRGRPARLRRQARARPRCRGSRAGATPASRAPRAAPLGRTRGGRGARGARQRRHRPRSARSPDPDMVAFLLLRAARAFFPRVRAASREGRAAARPRGVRPGRERRRASTSSRASSSVPLDAALALQRGGRDRHARGTGPLPRDGPLRAPRRAARPPSDAPRRPSCRCARTRETLARRLRRRAGRRPRCPTWCRSSRFVEARRPRARLGARSPRRAQHPARLLRSPAPMLSVLRGARSLLSVLLVGLLLHADEPAAAPRRGPGRVPLPEPALPAREPVHEGDQRTASGPACASAARASGASAASPPHEPVLVVANHQSLTRHPADHADVDAARARVRHPQPLPALRPARLRRASVCSGRPIVDPRRDPEARARRDPSRGARELPHGLAIFPEGHRSRDGEILPFHAAGTEDDPGASARCPSTSC